MPIIALILKELAAIAAGIGLWEFGRWIVGKGWRWLLARFGRRAVTNPAQARQTALEAASEGLRQWMNELQQSLAAARARGDAKEVARLEDILARAQANFAQLQMVSAISAEKKVGQWLAAAGVGSLVLFTVEEFHQSYAFRQNLEIQRQMTEERNRAQMEMVQAMRERAAIAREQMMADERNRAFWAWYIQQKAAIEEMKQRAFALRGAMRPLRQAAGGRARKGYPSTVEVAHRAYIEAVKAQWGAWRAWQKALAEMTRARTQAALEAKATEVAKRWDAYIEAMKGAQERMLAYEKAVYDMLKERQEKDLQARNMLVEGQIKAALEQLRHQLTMERELLEGHIRAALEGQRAIAELIKERQQALFELARERERIAHEERMRALSAHMAAEAEAARAMREGRSVVISTPFTRFGRIGWMTIQVRPAAPVRNFVRDILQAARAELRRLRRGKKMQDLTAVELAMRYLLRGEKPPARKTKEEAVTNATQI